MLKKNSQSGRALLGRAKVFDKQSELQRSNKMLGSFAAPKTLLRAGNISKLFPEQSIEEYLKVLGIPDAPKQLKLEAGRRCADRQTFRGELVKYELKILT